ncbi:PepSY-like domain-containing protein [Nonlabens antarcticus]|uniref:PepSY-like domain-containing protein n=1 Tax=Nonlabens antarcticus TaxID=392714 RepID=UPI001890E347|nr:PepSY-like domain-containing protein [Nonlabens antarcticus]
MKNLKIAVIAMFATAAVTAQDLRADQVPSDLNNSFQKEFPQATDIEWEMNAETYKVEFDMGRMDHEIWYSKDGKKIKTEMEITEAELPASIAATLKKNYNSYNIEEVEVTEENGTKTYEIELEKWFSDDIKLIMSEKGIVIREWK